MKPNINYSYSLAGVLEEYKALVKQRNSNIYNKAFNSDRNSLLISSSIVRLIIAMPPGYGCRQGKIGREKIIFKWGTLMYLYQLLNDVQQVIDWEPSKYDMQAET